MKRFTILLAFMMLVGLSLHAQSVQISGNVTSAEDGSPLPGVSVVVKGTTIGTVTNFNGGYALAVPQSANTLVFSFVGMKTQEVPIAGQTLINVALESDFLQLEEIVVTGVGAATDLRRVAISVETVSSEEFLNSSTGSIDKALIGKVPGALIQSVSGQPGQQQSIMLRGVNSLGSTQPMILIDGVQILTANLNNGSSTNLSSRLSDIDFADVERVEVVQGAAAATIYGAQGANGVIQIFTKSGKTGKTVISYSSQVSIDNAITNDYQKADKHYFNTDGSGFMINSVGTRLAPDPVTGIWPAPVGTIDGNAIINKPFAETTYDHIDLIFKDNVQTWRNTLSASGGSDNFTFHGSLANTSQESIINGHYKRLNGRLNLRAKLSDKLTLDLRSNVITADNTTGGITGANNRYSALGSSINLPQFVDLKWKDANGGYTYSPMNDLSANPFYTFENRKYSADVTRVIQNVGLNYKFTKFVELDAKYGIDYYNHKFRDILRNQNNNITFGVPPFDGRYIQRTEEGVAKNAIVNAFISFDLMDDFGSSLPLVLRTQISADHRENTYKLIEAEATGAPLYEPFLLNVVSNPLLDQYESIFRTYGVLLNQKIDIGTAAGVSFGGRLDYSSAFGEGSEPFFFPRADAYVRISELGFFSGVKELVPEWKLRAAYGQAGIQPGPFDRLITLGAGTIGTTAFYYPKLSSTNPALQVQVSKELEIGTDVAIALGDTWFRFVKLGLTYWNRDSEDVIRAIDVAPSTGASTILENAFTLSSNGIQASINVAVANMKDLSWYSTLNFGKQTSTIENIVNKADIVVGDHHVLKEGQEVGTFYGIIPLTSVEQLDSKGERIISAANAANFSVASTGYVVNNTSKQLVFDTEKVPIGSPYPDFTLAWINDITIGKFINLSTQLDWVYGLDVYNATRQWQYRDMLHADLTTPVSINGVNEPWAAYYLSAYQTNQKNSIFVEDGSFIRLRDITLSVKLNKIINSAWFENFDLSVSGRNLLTITKYTGLDPEAAAGLNSAWQRGLDEMAFPNFKSIVLGIKVDL